MATEDAAPERFVSPCKPPEGYERELLTILAEECTEVAKRACKALRFGVQEVQPGQPHTNATRLALEVGDLQEVVRCLVVLNVLSEEVIWDGGYLKRRQLEKFLQTPPSMRGPK